ncbi:aminoglycoside phosphotransferase family protein [Streptomyces sp. NPDC058525]|uniref:aminoglycoside phosphotransferase family protein n=1 Tax=Streptomyces sp. NPDC058525 TaxID=3346538 RepID=UPI0036632A7A
MKANTPLPSDLQQWAANHLPGLATATVSDASWPRGDSRIWKVATGSTAAFVKLYPSPDKFGREIRGCEHATRALTADEAPQVIAANDRLPAVILTALTGDVVRGLELAKAEEQRVHQLAGKLLRRWHDSPTAISVIDRENIMAAITAQAGEAATCLDRIGDQLSPAARDLVTQVSTDLVGHVQHLPHAFRHGDYSPRNWLWDQAAGLHSIIDFEEAAPGIPVEDLVWLCGAMWPDRPDLRRAFLAGYGRDLSPHEDRALILLTTRLGVSYLATGLAKQDQVLIDRGHSVVDRMVRAVN